MFSLVSLALTFFLVSKKSNVAIYIILYGFGFVVFSFALDGVVFGFWDYMYVYNRVDVSLSIIYYWLVFVLSYIVFFNFLSNKTGSFLIANSIPGFLRFQAYIFSFLSLASAAYNTYSAGDIGLLFSNPRAWELAFGRSAILNYFYFMHLVALVLFGILAGLRIARVTDFIFIIALLASSLLHGIKFTIVHAFLFFVFSFMIARGEKITFQSYVLGAFLIGILLLFFTYSRGGGIDGFFGYIVSASVNSMYIINNKEFYEISSISVLNPLSFMPIERFQDRILNEGYVRSPLVGFFLNDKYNLQHAITKVGYAFGVVFVFYSFVFSCLINYLRRSPIYEYHKVFLLVMIMSSVLLFFTGFDFYKTKLWFCLIVSFFSYYFFSFFNKRV